MSEKAKSRNFRIAGVLRHFYQRFRQAALGIVRKRPLPSLALSLRSKVAKEKELLQTKFASLWLAHLLRLALSVRPPQPQKMRAETSGENISGEIAVDKGCVSKRRAGRSLRRAKACI